MQTHTTQTGVRPLEWRLGKGDAPTDAVWEAYENPDEPAESDTWQIARHDGVGPAFNWFRYDSSGDILDIGQGHTVEDCQRQIADTRGG